MYIIIASAFQLKGLGIVAEVVKLFTKFNTREVLVKVTILALLSKLTQNLI